MLLRKLMVLFLLFWLPLQGWGVSVMPFSRPDSVMWMRSVVHAGMPGCPHHHHDTTSCDHCDLCQLASAPAAIVVATRFSPIDAAVFLPAVILAQPENIPNSFDRPPRA